MKTKNEKRLEARLACLDAHGACFLDLGGDTTTVQAAPAPDTTALANASKESAEIMGKLGQDQLTEARRQYDTNIAVAKPVADAQLGIMQQTQEQGKDYYDYNKESSRPVEQALNTEAMAAGSEGKQQEQVDRAVADTRGGYTRALNTGFRQARRYGLNPASVVAPMGVTQATTEAAAATGARDKEKALGFAKKLDVAGIYRNLPGASTAAYGVATNAGNSAVGNTMAPGQALQSGMSAGAGTVGAGRSLYQSGLGGVLGADTSYAGMVTNANLANAQYANQGPDLSGLGALAGAGLKMYSMSSKKLKSNKEPVSEDKALAGLKRMPVEKWDYKAGVEDGGTHVGPYAEDVQQEFGDGVAPGGKKIDLVSMNGITIAAVKGLAKKVAGIERKMAHRAGA